MACCCFCDCCCCDCILAIIAFFLPPLPVMIKRGLCSCDVLINICLCMLGYIPGLIHSWYIILQNPDRYDNFDDIERQQIFVTTTPGSPQVYVTQQPDQTRIRFSHPEPFAESNQSDSQSHFSTIPQRPLSPLSRSPVTSQQNLPTQYQQNKPQILSPLSGEPISNNNNYGSTLDFLNEEEDSVPQDAPPSYDNVMNETSKQFS